VIQGGYGYADGKLNVIESGSEGFEGSFGTSSMGTIESITFEKAGRWFLGNPERVEIYHGPGCAEADAGCSTTRQEGTIGRIDIVDAGSGYVDGVLALSGGGGGSGVDASFLADEDTGAITSVRFAAVSSRGSGYTQDPSVDVAFLGATRCDDGSSVVRFVSPFPAFCSVFSSVSSWRWQQGGRCCCASVSPSLSFSFFS
jgi:hypothetical protein